MQKVSNKCTKLLRLILLAILLVILGCVLGDGIRIAPTPVTATPAATATAPPEEVIYSLSTCFSLNELDDYVTATDTSECDSVWVLATVNSDKIEIDTRTGLMWSRESAAGDIITEVDGVNNGAINWFEAVGTLANTSGTCTNADHTGCNPDGESYCGKLNSLNYGGYNDWRSPGQKEFMQAYVDGGTKQATVFNKGHFYWANTTESDSVIWGAYFRFGYGSNADFRKNSSSFYAICVRNTGQAQISEINGCKSSAEVDDYSGAGSNECNSSWSDETLVGDLVSKDPRTRLMWSRESNGTDFASEVDGVADGLVNWYEAIGESKNTSGICIDGDHSGCNPDGEGFCQILNAENYAGFSNWRVAGQKEFMQAYIDGGSQSGVFALSSFYAANTSESDDTTWGTVRRFGYGNGADYRKNKAWFKAICVRSY